MLRDTGTEAAAIPRKARVTRPREMISPATHLAVFEGTAKEIPCAIWIMAVLTPMTRPRESASGPPELPGLRATSVWMMLSMSRPAWPRSERPSAEITPAETVLWKPSGLPMATASWPTRRRSESAKAAKGRRAASAFITARSVAGSVPTTRTGYVSPSVSVIVSSPEFSTTWLLVRTNPSGAMISPLPAPSRPQGVYPFCLTRTATTAGPTKSTTLTTARE